MTETHIAGELHGLSAHPGDIYHRAAMTVEMLIRERDEARADALSLNGQLQIAGRRFDHADAAVMAAEARITELTRERDEARDDALEEAAKVADGMRYDLSGPYPADREDYAFDDALEQAAANIRALKEPVASLRKAGPTKPNCPNLEEGKHD